MTVETEERQQRANDRAATRTTSSGNVIAFREYGDAHGTALLYLHGTPGSSLEASGLEGPARQMGVRVVAIDRPGYGDSSPVAATALNHWITELPTFMAELGAERFPVVAVSGGTRTALLLALKHPEIVSAIALLSPAAPVRTRADRAALFRGQRLLRLMRIRMPGLGARLDEVTVRNLKESISDSEPTPNSDRRSLWARVVTHLLQVPDIGPLGSLEAAKLRQLAFRNGAAGLTADGVGQWGGWPELGQIGVPICLWYGGKDVLVPGTLVKSYFGTEPGIGMMLAPEANHWHTTAFAADALEYAIRPDDPTVTAPRNLSFNSPWLPSWPRPAFWTLRGPGTLSWDRDVNVDGGALRIDVAETAQSEDGVGLAQRFEATAFRGQRIRLSARLRGTGADGRSFLRMLVYGERGTDRPGSLLNADCMVNRLVPGETDWRTAEIILDVPPRAGHISIAVLRQGAGTTWVDGLELSTIGPSGGEYVGGRPTSQHQTTTFFSMTPAPMNLGFEDGAGPSGMPTAWGVVAPVDKCVVDPAVSRSTGSSCRFTYGIRDPGKAFGVRQRFPAVPYRGSRVRLTGWLRTDTLESGSCLLLSRHTPGSPKHTSLATPPAAETGVWTFQVAEIDVSDDALLLEIGTQQTGPGTTWIDDLELMALTRESTGPTPLWWTVRD